MQPSPWITEPLHNVQVVRGTQAVDLLSGLDASVFFPSGKMVACSWETYLTTEFDKVVENPYVNICAALEHQDTGPCASISTGVGYQTPVGFVLQVFVYFDRALSKTAKDYSDEIAGHFRRHFEIQRHTETYWLQRNFLVMLASTSDFSKEYLVGILSKDYEMIHRTLGYGSRDIRLYQFEFRSPKSKL